MKTPWGDLPVHDAHVHFFSRPLFQWLAGQTPGHDLAALEATLGWRLPPENPADLARNWIAELDRHGVGCAALIASFPGDEASVLAAADACPGRFWPYAMVNAAAPNAPVASGIKAVCLFPAMHRYSLHDPAAGAVVEKAASQGSAIFVHCGVLTVGVRRKLGLASPFDMRFSNPLDLHAIALRYPKTPFVVPHFGAGMLREALMLADLCPNVYLDTSSTNSWMRYEGLDLPTVFRRALDVVGPGRLLFGTDSSFFPRGWCAPVFAAQAAALQQIGVDEAAARQILGGNLERILS
jgi:predicted TIM-barrel fold metal-dependent hydrolase